MPIPNSVVAKQENLITNADVINAFDNFFYDENEPMFTGKINIGFIRHNLALLLKSYSDLGKIDFELTTEILDTLIDCYLIERYGCTIEEVFENKKDFNLEKYVDNFETKGKVV